MIDHITIGWVWLERTLNRIIDQVNRQHPIASTTVAIEESPNGTLFKVAAQQTDQASANSGARGTTQPGAQPVIWHNVTWKTVTVVDPNTCAQSQISIPVQSSGGQIIIQ